MPNTFAYISDSRSYIAVNELISQIIVSSLYVISLCAACLLPEAQGGDSLGE